MSGYLLDTNVSSEMTRPRPSERVESSLQDANDELFLGVLSVMEMLRGIHRLPQDPQGERLQRWLDDKLRPWVDGRLLPVT